MKKQFQLPAILIGFFMITVQVSFAQTVSTFDALPLETDSFWNGSEMPSGTYFYDGNGIFPNNFNPDFGGYWVSGWSYSNMRDSTTAGFSNIYSAITGIGFNNTPNYAVGTYAAVINLTPSATGKVLSGLYVTNATVTTLSMKNGDAFAKKFGGVSGDDPDWFKLTFRSYYHGALTTDSVEMYLADYRFADNQMDYILKTWEWVDLTSLGNTDSLAIFLYSSDTGDFGINTPAYFCIDNFTTADYEIFAPPVGQEGTTAIRQDSSVFVAWATGAQVTRGYQDISDPSLGLASAGDSTMALGSAGANGTVSLGDGGSAVLTFDHPVINGDGWDFAVFENSFSDAYLELAFVEVSSDGIHYVRFPSTSYTQNSTQIDGFGSIEATQINNLAGKYRANYGTPFDLEELAGEPDLDVNHITHIKLIDVVGSINPEYSTSDHDGRVINDPWPTPFAASGFDLDAVGVIHAAISATEDLSTNVHITTYPNPAKDLVYVTLEDMTDLKSTEIQLLDYTGRIIKSEKNISNYDVIEFNLKGICPGVYFISVVTTEGRSTRKLIVQK